MLVVLACSDQSVQLLSWVIRKKKKNYSNNKADEEQEVTMARMNKNMKTKLCKENQNLKNEINKNKKQKAVFTLSS